MTVTIDGTTGITGATWTTVNKPSSPVVGQRGFNTTLDVEEVYDGTQWQSMSAGFTATGGTITESGGYTIHTFNSSGTFTPAIAGAVDYLVVAGGGGGGGYAGSGGGAGGFKTATSFAVAATGLTVTVGAGGAGGAVASASGSAGNDSVFSTITSTGGGYGATGYNSVAGGVGGSGGGATNASTASGTGSEGSAGGAGTASASQGGGGGGGASAVGTTGVSAAGGDGGAGTSNSYSGSAVTYAGGGGGGNGGSNDTGGGTGTGDTTPVNSGEANTGGGGGGAGYPTTAPAGNGGSGIVIVRYPTASRPNLTATFGYACRAWVNFNGTGNVAIRASGNVSSITDHGTGDYTMNFTVAMVDANYSICGTTVGTQSTYYNQIFGSGSSVLAVGSTRFRTANSVDPSSPQDSDFNHVVIIR